MIVKSFIPGRVRLRAPALKDQQIANRLMQIAAGRQDIVRGMEHNPVSGSLLVHYDAQKVGANQAKKLRAHLPFLLRLQAAAERYHESDRQTLLSMLDTLEQLAQSL